MSTSAELMYAILAMDSYNRSYNAGIEGLGGLLSQIGTATLVTDSEARPETQQDGQDAGFYAVAYEWTNPDTGSVETIISYRGTDVDAVFRPGSRATFVSAKVTKTIDASTDLISGDGREEEARTNSLASNKARVEQSARLRGRPAGVERYEPKKPSHNRKLIFHFA